VVGEGSESLVGGLEVCIEGVRVGPESILDKMLSSNLNTMSNSVRPRYRERENVSGSKLEGRLDWEEKSPETEKRVKNVESTEEEEVTRVTEWNAIPVRRCVGTVPWINKKFSLKKDRGKETSL